MDGEQPYVWKSSGGGLLNRFSTDACKLSCFYKRYSPYTSEKNDMIWTVSRALDVLFADGPPRFMHRSPHGYADKDLIASDLDRAGLPDKSIHISAYSSQAATPRQPAIGYCHGSPLIASSRS